MKAPSTKIAVLASGRGSNFDALMSAIDRGELPAEVVALVSDQPRAGVLEKARARGIHTVVIPVDAKLGTDERRIVHEREILKALAPLQPRFLVLAGYMRIMTQELIGAFHDDRGYSRIVNVHPSLLPAFPGVNSYARAFEYGAKVTGVTVHLVDGGVDSGPICAQEAFSITDCGSVEEVERRGLEVEHRLYPATLRWILEEKFGIEMREVKNERRLCVRPN